MLREPYNDYQSCIQDVKITTAIFLGCRSLKNMLLASFKNFEIPDDKIFHQIKHNTNPIKLRASVFFYKTKQRNILFQLFIQLSLSLQSGTCPHTVQKEQSCRQLSKFIRNPSLLGSDSVSLVLSGFSWKLFIFK